LRVVVTGAGGMVGQAVSQYCQLSGDEVLSYDRQSLNIADGVLVEAIVEKERPDAVINCAAWTDVDGCEFDPARAYAVIAMVPENLANASRRLGAVLVTIFSEYLSDGKKVGFYTQRYDAYPESVYGV